MTIQNFAISTSRFRPLSPSVLEYMRSLVATVMGVAADLVVLEILVRGLALHPVLGKSISMTVSVIVQFIASRRYAFRARNGDLRRQLKWFAITEVIGMSLVLMLFQACVHHVRMPMEIASMVSGAVIYHLFTYPVWKRIFGTPAVVVVSP